MPDNRARQINLNIRISGAESEMLKRLAETQGLSQSDVIRQLLRREATNLGARCVFDATPDTTVLETAR